ncbi:MAG: hypothetical protein H0T92_20135 [Pyrinomonadaceae bacterium]|nr:hypothetical protein [Pyrinomonadaceae bacterium]
MAHSLRIVVAYLTRKAGFTQSLGKGLGVAISDFDADGWSDIAVANDSFPQ